MTPIERLQTALNGLGLKAVEARLESLLEQASKKEPSYADFLDELLSCEVDARRSRYLRARLQLAHLPFLKNFDQFDFGFQPSIANLYMNRFLKYWRITGRSEVFRAQVVNYADDFVILSRGCAAGTLNWTRNVMTRIGLTLNEAKTSIKQARKERFDFLGYSFGPHRLRKNGHEYLGASPSKKSVSKLRQKVGDLLVRQNVDPWTEVRDRLNRILQGWSNYFGYGTRLMAYRAVDQYVYERVRSFLRRRHKVSSRGSTTFSDAVVFGKLGVPRLRDVHLGRLP